MRAISRSGNRPITAIAGAMLLIAVASAAPAVAAPPPYFTFNVTLGETDVNGTGPNNDNVVLVLRDRAGFVKDRVKATTDGTGNLNMERGFTALIENGDSIRATDGVPSHARTFVIPRLTAAVNRVTNVVSGLGPAGKSVDVSACVATGYNDCNTVGPYNTPVNANGNYSYNFSPTNLRGFDDVDVVWHSATNDSVRREVTVPFVNAIFGGNSFIGTAPRGSVVNMALQNKNGQLKAKTQASASAFFGLTVLFFGEFRKQAYPVNVRAGDKIVGTYAADGSMTVPSVSTGKNAGTDRVSGHCFNNAFFEVSAHHQDGSDSAYYDGKTGANGNFNVDITANNATYDLLTDDVILLACRNNRGDTIGTSLFGLLLGGLTMQAALAKAIREGLGNHRR
jgi:hypothetical protein